MAASRDDETNGQDPGGGGGGGGRSPREDTPPAPCAAFCGPRSCSTLPPSLSPQQHQQHQQQQQQAPVSTEPKRRRLWGLRGLVKMFRRRVRRRVDENVSPQPPEPTLRARSTSELAVDIQHSRNSGPYNQGLSVSHDSVFSPDTSSDSHHHAHTTPPSLAIATRGVNMAELKAVLRRRRGDDSGSGDDDPGLPRSPPTSPTTLDVLNHGLKSCSRATQSTCSDGSLLSMGSSENDEDSLGIGSHHSSKVSLLEGRHQVVDNEPVAGAVPLSHQAALHKIAVRPRRTHGAPRSRRSNQIGGQRSLPATPEVNEESNSKNATPPKPTFTTMSAHEMVVTPPLIDDYTRQESPISVDSRDSEKKEKEEKRDEPLLQRIFGSVRSGRRRSRGTDDSSRESSISPMRRGTDQRVSREKRRDSSGSRFPVLGRTSTKTRQESHPLPPSGRAREPSRERTNDEPSPPSPQTPRSASVEGRLESTPPTPQNIFRMTSYEERSSRPLEGVRKVKSFREAQGNVIQQEGYSKNSYKSREEGFGDVSNKKAASMENLDGDTKISSRIVSSSGISSTETTVSTHRSSVDSLTNTSIPGIYIRQQPQNQYRVFKHKHQDHQMMNREQVHNGQDVNSGPLSLDSSITLQSREPEDHLRKSSSVSHVGYFVENTRTGFAKDVELIESASKKGLEDKRVTDNRPVSKGVVAEEKLEPVIIDIKKTICTSLQTDVEGEIKTRASEDKELENESLHRRSLKKESSLKRLISRDPEPSPVPEFMRIQLNRVESKGHSVIYDTDHEKTTKADSKCGDISLIQTDTDASAGLVIVEKPAEGSNSVKIEPVHGMPENKSEKPYLKKSNSRIGKGLLRDISPSTVVEKKDQDSGVEGSSPEATVERVILRKPLVSERAPVMERATSVTSQTTPSPTKSDQPELFKVFARRSFKVKDADKEKLQSFDSDDDTNVEASSEISEVTVISTRASDNVTTVSHTSGIQSTIISTSQSSIPGLQKSSINAISFNRKSVGNPTLSFCPPPVNINSPSVSPISQKPTVLILSTSSSVPSTNIISSSSAISSSTNTTSTDSSGINIQYSKQSASPVQVSIVRPNNTTPEVHNSDITSEVSVPQQGGITSKIISNRLNNITASNDSLSGDDRDSSPTPPATTLTTSRPSRSGTGIVWPPRPQPEEEIQPLHLGAQSGISAPQQRKISCNSLNTSDLEGTKTLLKSEENLDPIEIIPLDIGAARRRFMSGGKDSHTATSILAQNLPTASASPPSGPSLSSITSTSPTLKGGPTVIESRNSAPSFTITVRTQTAPTESSDATSPLPPVSNTNSDLNTSTTSNSSGKSDQGTPTQAADDWRVLVRQRREGRLKQTKTPDAEEIIIETRPPVSRNSKVLEMANNFQKLQVA